MSINKLDLKDIIERSSSLLERMDSSSYELCNSDAGLMEKRLNSWCEAAAEGDTERFAYRLSKLGLDIEGARSLLGVARLKPSAAMPSWAAILEEILEYYDGLHFEDIGILDVGEPIAFEEVLIPYTSWALGKLSPVQEDYSTYIDSTIYRKLVRALLRDMSQLCTRVFEMEFTVFRATRQSPLDRFLARPEELPNNLYKEFVAKLQQGGHIALLSEYPVLAKLSSILCLLWLESSVELMQRVVEDANDICNAFCQGVTLGKLVDIEPNMSDRHHKGRTVAALTFENGLKLIYKPKCLKMEKAYFQALDRLNVDLQKPIFEVLKVINKESHGWIEFAEQIPCSSESELEEYYKNAGSLLAVLHHFRASDCHVENIIANGTYPVLVDAECLMHPYTVEYKKGGWDSIPEEEREKLNSVLRTGLLPGQLFSRGDTTIDIAGFGTAANAGKVLSELRWDKINTDFMSCGYFPSTKGEFKNLPILNGAAHYPEQHIEAIIEGFESLNSYLYGYTDALLPTDLHTRFVFRPTRTYAAALAKTLEPRFMRCGVDRSIELDALVRYTFTLDEDKGVWEILREELEALEALDVPYVTLLIHATNSCVGYLKNNSVLDTQHQKNYIFSGYGGNNES